MFRWGSLEVGSLYTAPIRVPIHPLDLMGVASEPYGGLPTRKLPSSSWKDCGVKVSRRRTVPDFRSILSGSRQRL